MPPTEKKIKTIIQGSWKFFETIFQKKNDKSELTLLLEAWMVSNPVDGFLVIEQESERGKLVFSLDEFTLNQTYISETGTKIVRTEKEVILSDKIKIPCVNKDYDTKDDETEPLVEKERSLTVVVHPSMAIPLIESLSGSSFEIGIPLSREDVGGITGRVVFSYDEIEVDQIYSFNASAETTAGTVQLFKFQNKEVQLQFFNRPDFILKKKSSLTKSTMDLDMNAVIASMVEPEQKEPAPVKPTKTKRSVVKDFFTSKKKKTAAPATTIPVAQDDSPSLKRKRIPLRERAQDKGEDEPLLLIDSDNTSTKPNLLDAPLSPIATDDVPEPPPPPAAPAPPPLPPAMTGRSLYSPRTERRKKLRTLKWTPLPDSKLSATIWKTGGEVPGIDNLIDKDLEDMFSESPKANRTVSLTNVTPKTGISLIDVKRANNIAILLTHIKMTEEVLRQSLTHFDESVLTMEKLIAIRSILPTEDEQKSLKSYRGDISKLGNVERYLNTLMMIPKVEARVEFFLFKLQFADHVAELFESIEEVHKACDEVKGSDKFSKIMKLILALGSVLNEGTYLSSNGFKIDSLLKLAETKARNNRTTLLHYLTQLIQNKIPELLNFRQDFPHVEAASKISLDVIVSEVRGIKGTLDKIGEEVQGQSKDKENDSFFSTYQDFKLKAKADVDSLVQNLDNCLSEFKNLSAYFGEENADEKMCKSFFYTVHEFSVAFENSIKKSAPTTPFRSPNGKDKKSIPV